MFHVIFFYAILFVFGLVIGSFFNVVILRYRPEKNVFECEHLSGRSHCPHCGKTLQWFELIPLLSFIVQRGKCSSCGGRLSSQYPIVEFLSGAIVAGVPLFLNYFYGFSDVLFVSRGLPHFYYVLCFLWVLVFLTWLLVAFIDLRQYLIPNELSIAMAVLGIFITYVLFLKSSALPPFHDSFIRHFALMFSPFTNVVVNHVIGAIVAGVFFAALSLLSRGTAMGFGDVKLALAAGLAIGWPDITVATILAFFFGGLWGLWLVISKRKNMHDRVPFAPFFILGSVVAIFLGYWLLAGYFSLFNI